MTGKRLAALVLFDLVALLIVAGLVGLSVWQVHRRAWKLDLVARVEARVHAPAEAAPGPERWPDVSAASDEYRRVTVNGDWLESGAALVQAVTELGGGYWVLMPLRRDDGTIVFVNRGFVPTDKREPRFWSVPAGARGTVTGLLRIPEPGGAFLRINDATANRWYSRDVAALAASRGLTRVAPYFIDAERSPGAGGLPVAGLTVLAFRNNHLVYAITWGVLALMAAWAALFVNREILRSARKRPRQPEPARISS